MSTHTGKFQPRHGRLLLCSDQQDQHRRKCAQNPPSRRIPDQCHPAARTWEESHPTYMAWQRSPKGKTMSQCGCTKYHRNPTRLNCQGSSRRTPAARTWGYRHTSKNCSSYTSTQLDLPQWNSRSYMKPHNVFHPHCRCTRSHRTLNQPLVLGCVPQTTRPGWQENVCSVSPTPSA